MNQAIHVETPQGQAGARAWRAQIFDVFDRLEFAGTLEDRHFHARLQLSGSGAARSGRLAAGPHAVRRVRPMSDTDNEVCLLLVESGSTHLEQDGLRLRLGCGDIAVFDNASPYTLTMPESFEHSLLLCRRSAFALELGLLQRHGPVRVAPGPMAAMLGVLLRGTTLQAAALSAAEIDRASAAVLQLCLGSLGPHRASEAVRDKISRSLFDRICAGIRCSLSDPALDPAAIARPHRISVRYLHKLFAQQGLQVMKFVRDERLAACARELRECSGRPHIGAVAARWGFDDDGSFRRAWRLAYGHAPSQGRTPPLPNASSPHPTHD